MCPQVRNSSLDALWASPPLHARFPNVASIAFQPCCSPQQDPPPQVELAEALPEEGQQPAVDDEPPAALGEQPPAAASGEAEPAVMVVEHAAPAGGGGAAAAHGHEEALDEQAAAPVGGVAAAAHDQAVAVEGEQAEASAAEAATAVAARAGQPAAPQDGAPQGGEGPQAAASSEDCTETGTESGSWTEGSDDSEWHLDDGLFESFVASDARHMARLTRLDLTHTRLGTRAVTALSQCSSLSTVLLPCGGVPSPGALAAVARLPALRCLSLSYAPCDDDTLELVARLTALTALRWLVLSQPGSDDLPAMTVPSTLTNLVALDLQARGC